MRRFRSIKFTLLGWFLTIALIPMILLSAYGYFFASQSLQEVEEARLDATARMNVQFVNNWFFEVERDASVWAKSEITSEGIVQTSLEWKKTNLSLNDFVRSSRYAATIQSIDVEYRRLINNYDYAYDLMLIDVSGNILYTVKRESDFGTNLQSGVYAHTRFAQAVRLSLIDGKMHFSDTELYSPAKGLNTGFIIVPVLNNRGKLIGIMAVKLQLKNLTIKLEHDSLQDEAYSHYLVGLDGLLRTQRKKSLQLDNKRIDTEVFLDWKKEHGTPDSHFDFYMHEVAKVYRGPDDVPVLGKHYAIDILGVKWAHISEISTKDAFKASNRLGEYLLLVLMLGGGMIVWTAAYLSGRITRPILELREVSEAFSSGKTKIITSTNLDNEIGDLAVAFRKMLEKQLEDAREIALLAQVVGSNPYPTIITDSFGIIEYVNERMIHESGYTKNELIGMNMTSFRSRKHDEAYYAHLWNTVGVEKKSWHGVLASKIKTGELRDWKTTAFALFNQNNSIANHVFILEDVTEQNMKDRLFVMQTRQAQMGEMLSMIAHQWRQPLAIINALVGQQLFSNMMQEEPDLQLEENLRKIEEQSLHLSHTINDFRDFFRPDKQQDSIECSRLVENAVHLIDHAIKVSTLLFEIKVISDPVIKTYTNEMVQVIITLIKNSLDAFEENQIQGRNLTISIDQKDSYAIIAFEDNAGGINDEIIERIFLPYFTTKGEEKGTGLGLYMAKIVVEENCNGTLGVKSKGENTTFTIMLPLLLPL